MTRAVYVIGGAGTGKSTFTSQLLGLLGCSYEPLEDLYSLPNKKQSLVTLRGHRLTPGDGLYLGVHRPSFPGTDGLDRASSFVGADWLRTAELPSFIVAEGATLSTRPFIGALAERTELLLIHLVADPFLVDLRCLARGSVQADSFLVATATRARNLAALFEPCSRTVDSGDLTDWTDALAACADFLPIQVADRALLG
jgi:hypothetical protein